MLKFYIIVPLFSALVNQCVLQEFPSCSPSDSIRIYNTSYGSSMRLGARGYGGYVGYLEVCFIQIRGTSWVPVCGGELWTNREARVACNQLGYPNTTSLAITGGLCSTSTTTITRGAELECSDTETILDECGSSEATCNLWAGIICTSLQLCSEQICSNSSYCQPSSSCSNCSISQELNCICYGECSPPCMNGGSCAYNNTCQCPLYWTGLHCEQYLPTTTTPTNSTTTTPTNTTTTTTTNSTTTTPTNTQTGKNLSTTDTSTQIDNILLMRNVSNCQGNCLNGGLRRTDGNCECSGEYTGPNCENEKGSKFPILYAVISILIFLLFISVFIGSLAVVIVIFQRAQKKNRRTPHDRTQSENQTISPLTSSKNTLEQTNMTTLSSQDEAAELQEETTYHDTTLIHNCQDENKSIPNNLITTGNYDLVGPVVEEDPSLDVNNKCCDAMINDALKRKTSANYDLVGPAIESEKPFENNNMCREYAEVMDAPEKKASRKTQIPTSIYDSNCQFQEYSELDHVYKDELRSLTLDTNMKGHQWQLGNYSKLDHGMLHQTSSLRRQHPRETYSTLDSFISENKYHKTETKHVTSDMECDTVGDATLMMTESVKNVDVQNKHKNDTSEKKPEGTYIVTEYEILSAVDRFKEPSHPLEITDKSTKNYDHCTLKYNPQYNCN